MSKVKHTAMQKSKASLMTDLGAISQAAQAIVRQTAACFVTSVTALRYFWLCHDHTQHCER